MNLSRPNHPALDEIIYLETVDSTNLEAHRRRSEFPAQNILFISEEQTAGKGQHGRQWESTAGLGLWMTLLLGRPLDLEHNLQLLSLYCGIVIQETIASLTTINTTLKWPNDIMIGSQKCGGILTEIQWHGSSPKTAIIGVGLNVHHGLADFPSSIRDTAISLGMVGWKEANQEQIVERILHYFFSGIDRLNQPIGLAKAWNIHAFKLNELVWWNDGSDTIEGKFLGVNQRGEAQIQIQNTIKSYGSGEIHLVKFNS